MDEFGNCLEGSMRCGNPNSISRGVCLPKSIGQCPITQILQDYSNSDQTIETIEMLSGQRLWISRSESSNPISDLTISEDHVCLDPTVDSITKKRVDYTLSASKRSRCVNDTRYMKLDDIGEETMLNLNEIPYQRLPKFETSDAYKWARYFKTMSEWRPECLPEVPGVLSFFDNLVTTVNINSFFYWVSMLNILAVCCLVIFGHYQVSKNEPKQARKKVQNIRVILLLLMMPVSIFNIYRSRPLV